MLSGEAGKVRVVLGHGGTGGITLPYRPGEPLKAFVQRNGGPGCVWEEACEGSMGHRLEEATLNTGDSYDRSQGRRA